MNVTFWKDARADRASSNYSPWGDGMTINGKHYIRCWVKRDGLYTISNDRTFPYDLRWAQVDLIDDQGPGVFSDFPDGNAKDELDELRHWALQAIWEKHHDKA